jgi:hypothetical protein
MRLWLIVVLLLAGAFAAQALLPSTVLDSFRIRDRSWVVHVDLNNVTLMLLLAAAVLILLFSCVKVGFHAR